MNGGERRPRGIQTAIAVGPFVILAVLPLVLLACNDSWIWDSPYYHDTNVYVGFFRHYLDFKMPYIANYKSSRLPFVLPGVLLYRFLPAAAAHHALFLLFHTAGTTLLFALTRRRFGQHAAFTAAAALAVFTYAHTTTSYHNQAAFAYFIGSLLLLEVPHRWPAAVRAALAGAVFTLAVTTNTVVAGLTPVFALHALAALRPRSLVRTGGYALAALGGSVFALGALGAINAALGGPFLFFLEEVMMSLHLAKMKGLSSVPLADFARSLQTFPWLVLPLITALASVVLLTVQIARKRRLGWSALEAAGLLISLGVAVVMQVRGLGMLEYPHLFHPFFAPMFLALAGLLHHDQAGAEGGHERLHIHPSLGFLLAASMLALAPLCFAGAPLSRLMVKTGQDWPALETGVPFALALAAAAAGIGWWFRRSTAGKAMVSIAAIGVINAVCPAPTQPAYLYQAGDVCPFRRETFDALLEADTILSEFDPENLASWVHSRVSWDQPLFDGKGWCRRLPVSTVARSVLLPHYFYTSDQFIHGTWMDNGSRLPTKLVIAARNAAQADALLQWFRREQPPDAQFLLRIERRIKRSTFSILLQGYDIAPPE